ncbi:MAG: hypothetical protein M3275_12650 [Thermoproteota archaeon]|nr:hypothetical protein [Thermoproteota archaeon]
MPADSKLDAGALKLPFVPLISIIRRKPTRLYEVAAPSTSRSRKALPRWISNS